MTSSPSPTLLSIVALARSGSLDLAWRRLEGLGAAGDDPAALTVRGRLLKDRALAASGPDRRALYREAAAAYGRAGELGGAATYPFINAATLSLLAGDASAAREAAERVLGLIQAGEDGPETPYWREATRAEALLLLERGEAARAALAAAVALAPRAWEDHASTLRQFGLILEAQGTDAAWLDAHRPPRVLHFAGHMGVETAPGELAAQVDGFLARERIGFGYGALAAGADIVIAEGLLANGAELHLVLPAPPEAFAAASVSAPWRERFEAVLARADSVQVTGRPEPLADAAGHQLAAEAAMGCAVMQARMLMTEAVQLLVLDGPGGPGGKTGGSAWIGSRWLDGRRRQEIQVAPRVGARPRPEADAGERTLAALVVVRPDGAGWAGTGRLEAEILPRLGSVLAGPGASWGPMLAPPHWSAGSLSLAFTTLEGAAAAALAVADILTGQGSFQIAAHYGPVRITADPFGGPDLLLGPATELPGRLLASTPPGAVHVSGDFACALNAGPAGQCPRLEQVGELPLGDGEEGEAVYSMRARPA